MGWCGKAEYVEGDDGSFGRLTETELRGDCGGSGRDVGQLKPDWLRGSLSTIAEQGLFGE